MEHWGNTEEVKDAARTQRRIDDKAPERAAMSEDLSNDLLHRFWFECPDCLGYGVTAYTRGEAESIARDAATALGKTFTVTNVIEDVDISKLDQGHVVPNMRAPNFHGLWYPQL